MDGFKRRLKDSLQFRLSFSLALAILIVALVAGIFSFASAFDEAHDLQDDVLRQIATLLERVPPAPAELDALRQHPRGDEESRVIVQYVSDADLHRSGNVDTGAPLPIPAALSDGMHTLELRGESFRVLIDTLSDGRRIAIAQETGMRNEIARDSALRTLTPFLLLVPVLLVIVAKLVREMFRPIAALSAELDERESQALHPLAAQRVPVEIRPFVTAINRLLERIDAAMAAQRRFVADAAHELRSPLTALSLQAERLAEAPLSEPARERLGTLRRGIERGRVLLEQLLSLARAQAAPSAPEAAVSALDVYRSVLEDLLPLAEAKRIDLGVASERDAWLYVNRVDLLTLIKNLVDNAIRYTPDGGRVDLSIEDARGGVRLGVADSGPGIPAAERARVFDPFYRVLGTEQLGSGLGLSIVKAIAERLGATLDLTETDAARHRGLNIGVVLPARLERGQEPAEAQAAGARRRL